VPIYLTEAEVGELLTPADALEAVEGCFRRLAEGVIENVPRRRLRLEGGAFAVMSAVDRELGLAGLKSYAWLEDGTPFVVVLFDTERAELAAVIEADKLGQLRTGAASGVAAKYLAREGASSLGVIGCGWQARSQVACIREALPGIERVVAYCRSQDRLEARTGWRSSAGRSARSRARATGTPLTRTSSSRPRPRVIRCCGASGSGPARSSAPSARTIRTTASWTTSSSSGRPWSPATRWSRRGSSPAT